MARGSTLLLVFSLLPGVALASPNPLDLCRGSEPTKRQAWEASAVGLELLSRGEFRKAVVCLRLARRGLPTSNVVARDLAIALSRSGETAEALRILKLAANELGDSGGWLARSVVAAESGDHPYALHASRRAGGVEGDMVSAVLGDAEALRSLGDRLGEVSEETPLMRLVLAAAAAEIGAVGPAEVHAAAAGRSAEQASDADVFRAARHLSARLTRTPNPAMVVRARVRAVHQLNPGWERTPSVRVRDILGLRGQVEVAGAARLGAITLRGALGWDQRVFLQSSDENREFERGGLVAAASFSVPFSYDLRAAEVKVGGRLLDVRDLGYSQRLGTALEGGATLRISVAPRLWGELGVLGVWSDFGDSSNREFDRDRVGQRARLALEYEGRTIDGGGELVVLHDEAFGQAFDALGATLGGGLSARLESGLILQIDVSATVRRWGSVGDQGVVGEVSRLRDLRLQARIGARWPLAPNVYLAVDNNFVRTDGPSGQGYVANALGSGLELVF